MQGIVKERAQTDSGAKYILMSDNKRYYCRDLQTFPEVGQKIEFEYKEFGEAKGNYGKPRSITSWKPIINGATGQPETGSTITDVDVLRSVSNIVGSACAAGTIMNAEELEKWFVAAYAGLTRRQKSATGREPGFDDDLPDGFYQSENPAPRTNGSGPNW